MNADHTNGPSELLSTPVKKDCFWKFKMKPIPLVIAVMLARGDFTNPVPKEPPHDPQ